MTQAFNLSQLANRVNTSGQLNASTGLFNQTPVANGGTGKSTVTTGALLLGAGTSAMTELTGTTPGTIVASSPTGWSAQPQASVGGGDYIMQSYTSPSVWTKPGTIKAIKVTIVGAGGNGGSSTRVASVNTGVAGGGGGGGSLIGYFDASAIPGPITVTAGAGTNSFGSLASCTAGSNGANSSTPSVAGNGGAGGTGTPSTSGSVVSIIGTSGYPGDSGNSDSGKNGVSALFNARQFSQAGTNQPGSAGTGYGSGGSGAGVRAAANPGTAPGGAGSPGIVIVEEFY